MCGRLKMPDTWEASYAREKGQRILLGDSVGGEDLTYLDAWLTGQWSVVLQCSDELHNQASS